MLQNDHVLLSQIKISVLLLHISSFLNDKMIGQIGLEGTFRPWPVEHHLALFQAEVVIHYVMDKLNYAQNILSKLFLAFS